VVDNVFCSGAIYQQISVGCEFKSRGRAEVIYGHPNLWAYVAMRTSMDHGITRAADWSDRALACIRWLDMVSRCLQLPPLSCYAYPVVSVKDRCCQSRAPCLLSRLEGKKTKSKKTIGSLNGNNRATTRYTPSSPSSFIFQYNNTHIVLIRHW